MPTVHLQHHPYTGLAQDLLLDWEAQNTMLCDEPAAKSRAKDESKCCRLGFCVCQGMGQQAEFMHQNLISFLRPFLYAPRIRKRKKPGSDHVESGTVRTELRKLLDEAHVALHLQEVQEDMAQQPSGPETGWASVASDLLDESTYTPAAASLWSLVGHMNHSAQSGYMFSVLPLEHAAGQDPGRLQMLRLPRPVACHRSLEYFKKFVSPEKKWAVTVHFLQTSLEGYFQPGLAPDVLTVQQYLAVPGKKVFWQGRVREERLREAAQPPARPRAKPRAVAARHRPRRAPREPRPLPLPGPLPEGSDVSHHELSEEEARTDDEIIEDAVEPQLRLPARAHEPADGAPDRAPADFAAAAAEPRPDAEHADVPVAVRAPRAARAGPAGDSVRVHIPGSGWLVYYEAIQAVQAVCGVDGHGDCRRQRTVVAGRKRGQGRCLGHLTAWLLAGRDFATRQAHQDQRSISLQARQDARQFLLGLEGAASLLEKERPTEAGEAEEPAEFS